MMPSSRFYYWLLFIIATYHHRVLVGTNAAWRLESSDEQSSSDNGDNGGAAEAGNRRVTIIDENNLSPLEVVWDEDPFEEHFQQHNSASPKPTDNHRHRFASSSSSKHRPANIPVMRRPHLSGGMPNVCERKSVHLRRDWKLCRKSRLGPFITYRSFNCTGSEEDVEGKGCLRHEQKLIYYDTLEPILIPDVRVEPACCRGWFRLGDRDFGCPYRSCEGECGSASLCRPGIYNRRCRCRPGLQGKGCNLDVDECTQDNGGCEEICQNTFGSYLCSCKPPKRLAHNGMSCVIGTSAEIIEIDGATGVSFTPMSTKNSSVTSTPASTSASTTVISTSTTIITTPETIILPSPTGPFYSCAVHNGGCAHICRRRQFFTSSERKSVLCDCFPGFHLAEDGRSCEDIDECFEERKPLVENEILRIYSSEDAEDEQSASSKTRCSQICRNTIGSFHCECYDSFQLHSDGFTCIQAASSAENLTTTAGSTNRKHSKPRPVSSMSDGSSKNTLAVAAHKRIKGIRGGGVRHRLRPASASFAVIDYDRDVAPISTASKIVDHYSSAEQAPAPTAVSKCADRNGGCSQICQDTPAGVVCSCTPGYKLDRNNTGCLDIDECSLGTHCCAETCINTPGSFKCECREGFRLAPNGCVCIDIDECMENTTVVTVDGSLSICDQICINTDGSYRCACHPGYQLSPLDKATCFKDVVETPGQDVNGTFYSILHETAFQVPPSETSSKIRIESIAFVPPSLRSGTAKEILQNMTSAPPAANCRQGFYGPNCSLECGLCRHNAPCELTTGACLCPKGTSGDRCQIGCPTGMYGPPDCSNRCSSKCVAGECDAELGFCHCQNGYFGPKCVPCPAWRYGKFCEGECDCDQEHTESCNATDGQCFCEAGFSGEKCDVPCLAGSHGPNCSMPCSDSCSLLCDPVSGQCPRTDCQNGYYGDSCSLPCPPGRYGPMCLEMCLECAPYGCDPVNGRCVCPPGKTGPQCGQDCAFGYFGSDCSQRCNCSVLMAPSANGGFHFASSSSKFLTELDSPTSLLDPATGNQLEAVGCDPATGVCYCPVGTYFSSGQQRCEPCSDGYYGVNCAQQCECETPPREYVPSPPPSQVVLDNNQQFYNNNQKPRNASHFSKSCDIVTGACLCEPGYRGTDCDQPCAAGSYGQGCLQKCQCGGHSDDCFPVDGRCNCSSGWMGQHCENACSPGSYGPNCAQPCDCQHENATCDRFVGTCICPPGYIGSTCETKCAPGFYGTDCQKKCECGYNNCHHITGVCFESPSMEEIDTKAFQETPIPETGENDATQQQQLTSEVIQGSGDSGFGTARSETSRNDNNNNNENLINNIKNDDQKSRERILETMLLGQNGETHNDQPLASSMPPTESTSQRQGETVTTIISEMMASSGIKNTERDERMKPKKTVAFASSREVEVRNIKEMVEGEQMLMVASGTQSPCPHGYFGPACQDVCPCQANGTCDDKGQCRCQPGYIGALCEHHCPHGYHGQDCLKRCRCIHADSRCDPTNGTCDCAPGFTGRHCSKLCPAGSFGRNCVQSCETQNCHARGSASCDRVTGACICNSGYTGPQCADRCPEGTYGPRCALKCGCLNGGVCHHMSGCCDCRQPGFVGTLCEHECDSGYWGISCNRSCSPYCRSNLCDRETGRCVLLTNHSRQYPARREGYLNRRRIEDVNSSQQGNNTNAVLIGPAETARSNESPRRPPRHFSTSTRTMTSTSYNDNVERRGGRPRCPPSNFGPDCSYQCSCMPAPQSKGCDRRTGRCHCHRGWTGPHCERHVEEFDSFTVPGRADVAPSYHVHHHQSHLADMSSSVSSSTERLYQQQAPEEQQA